MNGFEINADSSSDGEFDLAPQISKKKRDQFYDDVDNFESIGSQPYNAKSKTVPKKQEPPDARHEVEGLGNFDSNLNYESNNPMFAGAVSTSKTNPAKRPPEPHAGAGSAHKRNRLKVDYMDDGMPSDSDGEEQVKFDNSYAGPAAHLAL